MLHAPAALREAEIIGIESHRAALSPIEQQVVLLSLQDGPETIGDGPLLCRIWSRLFGIRPTNRLANPRLEALRGFCVRYLLGGAKPGAVLSLETMLAAAALIDSRLPRSTPSSEPPGCLANA